MMYVFYMTCTLYIEQNILLVFVNIQFMVFYFMKRRVLKILIKFLAILSTYNLRCFTHTL